MKLYRQSNTYFFMLINEFLYNGKLIEGMAISLKCYFDKEKVINIIIDEKGLEKIGFKVEYEIDGYFKLIKIELIQVSKKLFYKIMKEGIELELFDISGNKPTQVIGYTAYEIK